MNIHTIKFEETIFKVLCYYIPKIVKEEFNGAPFKKEHMIKEEDFPELLKIYMENIYTKNLQLNDLHEDDAGVGLGTAVVSTGVTWCGPRESRVNPLKINRPTLQAIYELNDMILSILHQQYGCAIIDLILPRLMSGEQVTRQQIVALANDGLCKACLESRDYNCSFGKGMN